MVDRKIARTRLEVPAVRRIPISGLTEKGALTGVLASCTTSSKVELRE